MNNKRFSVSGKVEIFPLDNPWVYVSVHRKFANLLKNKADRGLVPITATLGKSTWNTSLMPMGDGTQFIPLSAKIRKAEGIMVGESIRLSFALRKR